MRGPNDATVEVDDRARSRRVGVPRRNQNRSNIGPARNITPATMEKTIPAGVHTCHNVAAVATASATSVATRRTIEVSRGNFDRPARSE